MAQYVYEGPAPEQFWQDDLLTIVRPGDVRDFEEPPGWGAWRELKPETPETPAAVVPPTPPGTPAASPPAAATGTEG